MMVQYDKINRARVGVNNLNDENRVHDIVAFAWINETSVESLENGIISIERDGVQIDENTVLKENVAIATFYWYGGDNLSINFLCDKTLQDSLLNEINDFIESCKSLNGLTTFVM